MYLRPYRSADLDAIFALDRVCFPPRFRFSRALMRQIAEAPEAIVILACAVGSEGREELLGFCAVQMEDDTEEGMRFGYVSTLDVAPAARGQGVARTLMHAVQQTALVAGGACMLLHVFVDNLPAVRLYEALGYLRVGEERGFYGGGVDAWVYRRDLK